MIELVAALDQKDDILDSIQQKGVLEVSVPPETEGMTLGEYSAAASEAERSIQQLTAAREILSKYVSEKKPLTAMLEPRKELSSEEYFRRGADIDGVLKRCADVLEKDKRISDLKADNVRLRTLSDALEPWRNADIPLHAGHTSKTVYFLGSIKGKTDREELLKLLASEMPENECVEIETVSSDELQTDIAVFCMKEDADGVENVLRSAGFARAPECVGSAAETIAEYASRTECNKKGLVYGQKRQIHRMRKDSAEYACFLSQRLYRGARC